jgi:uncharacterized protein
MSRTALDLSPEEWRQYRPFQASPHGDLTASAQARREDALKTAKQAAQMLRDSYGAKKVVLFGSLSASSGFGRYSDIDLAAWGVPPGDFYRAVAAVTGISDQFNIDLIDPDNCRLSIREAIFTEGIEL